MLDNVLKLRSIALKDFVKKHYRHFNAAALADSAEAWVAHLSGGGKMLLAMGGAMSTAEIGISLAEMIRRGKIHAISTTGANLEEDIFNLVAHEDYKRIPEYRNLSIADEVTLRDEGYNRVTDTCIPEDTAMRKIEHHMLELWQKAEREDKRYFPYEYFYELIRSGVIEKDYQIDPKHSWVIAAAEKDIPVYTPGWEDSTLGNFIVSHVLKNNLKSFDHVKTGLEQMLHLVEWYRKNDKGHALGFFQIGGGIAGDFAICTVPLIKQDLKDKTAKLWSYFAQVSDSTTSFGSYSGASPTEKITWYKLDPGAPKFMIESDATIVVPLIFQYVLES